MIRRLGQLILVGVVVLVAVTLLGKRQVEVFANQSIALQQPQLFDLRPGTSVRSLAADLEAQGIIASAFQLRLFVRMGSLGSIKAGEYQFQPSMTHQQLLKLLIDGKVVQRQITFIEGNRAADYLNKLALEPQIESTLQGKSVEEIARLVGIDDGRLEGWIFPDTYSYTKGTKDIDILRRSYRSMKRVLDAEWAARQPGLPLASPYEALILASIVEKETAAPEERAEIAGVFIRRLRKNMRLQTDPTVIYGMGDSYQGNIRRADLKRATPYNTYRIRGLTPTPIASPGAQAIRAVLNPASGTALYFVAKGDGRHHFSSTLAEHNRAVSNYQRRNRSDNYRSVPQAPQSSETSQSDS